MNRPQDFPLGSVAFYGPVTSADLFASQHSLVHPFWGLGSAAPQQQPLPLPHPLSPPLSRPHSIDSSPEAYLPQRLSRQSRQGTETPVMEGFEDDVPVSSSTALSGLYLDVAAPASRSVKRPRPVKSCLECRKRKLKCDRAVLCSQCQKSNRLCKYSSEGNGGGSDADSDAEGERAPKRVQANGAPFDSPMRPPAPSSASYVGGATQSSGLAGIEEISSRLERLEKLLTEKQSPDDQSSPASSRTNAYQPRVPSSPITIRSLSVKEGMRTRFFGQNSPKVLLNLFDDARDFMRSMPQAEGFKELFSGMQNVYRALQADYRKGVEPIQVYLNSAAPLVDRMVDMLPNKLVCDRLLDAYLATGEGLFRIVHIPTFRQEYDQYWTDRSCNDSFLPRLLCMLGIASGFDAGSKNLGAGQSDGVHAPTASTLVRTWLDGLKGKQRVDIRTLQTELLLLHTQRTITPRHQDSWTQLGFIVRMAMTMGLHRDPSEFPKLSVFSGEIRRRLWYCIMDMDLYVALACNLPCAVREGEYSCTPPRNLDDNQLTPSMKRLPDSKPLDQLTTNQLQAYAASTLPSRMRVASILGRLDSIRDYSEVLDLGAKLERMLDDVNYLFPRNHSPDPQQRYKDWRLRFYLDCHIRRPLLALYRPFALPGTHCPPQILAAYLKSSVALLTYTDELDPQIPEYNDILHRFLLILKQDIVQAAFSLCYFIQTAPDNASSSKPNGQWRPNMSPAASESSGQLPSETRSIWSSSVLVKKVERAIDVLISMVQDSTSDLREILALMIVLNSVQAGSTEQKRERIKAGTRKILENMIDVLHTTSVADGIATTSVPFTPLVATQVGARQQMHATADMFTTTTPMNVPVDTEDFFQTNIPDEYLMWDNFLDYWNPTPVYMDDE